MNKTTIFAIGALILLGLVAVGYDMNSKKTKMANDVPAAESIEEHINMSTGVTIRDGGTQDTYFATKSGMSLYTFDKDEFNKSNCTGECLAKWPVYYATDLAVEDGFGVITREDGAQQSTYIEKPLYTFFKDELPGDTKGDGVKGLWHLVSFGK